MLDYSSLIYRIHSGRGGEEVRRRGDREHSGSVGNEGSKSPRAPDHRSRAHEELWDSRWQLRTANLSESEDKVPGAQEYTPGAFAIPRNLATLGTAPPQLLHTTRMQTLQ